MMSVLWVARMPAIRDRLSLTPSEIGAVLLATALGSIAAIPVVSRLSVTRGSDAVLRVSLPLLALGSVAIGVATSFALLLAVAVLNGMFLGATDVTMNAQASLLERRTGEPVLSRMHAGWSIGSAVGAGIAATTAAASASVAVTMGIGAIILIATWLPARRRLLADAMKSQSDPASRPKVKLPRVILLVGSVVGLAYLIEGGVIGWSTLYVHDVFGVVAWLAAVGYLAFELSMVTGRFFGDSVRRLWGDRRAALSGSALSIVGLALVVMAPLPLIAVAGLVIVGLGQAVVVPIGFASAGVAGGAAAAAAIARVGAFGYAGVIAGPAAFGVVAQAASMRAGFACLMGLAVVATLAIGSGAVVTAPTGDAGALSSTDR
jgi:sugar phosphate permease